MYEFGIEELQSLSSFAGDKKSFGAKPMMVFLGSQWEFDANYQRLQNLFLDLFRGFKPDRINLQGIDHVISCAIHEDKIFIRPYFVNYQRSTSSTPTLALQPMGPFLNLVLRRSQPAAEDLWKVACKKPKLPYVSSLFVVDFVFDFFVYFSFVDLKLRRLRTLRATSWATRLLVFT